MQPVRWLLEKAIGQRLRAAVDRRATALVEAKLADFERKFLADKPWRRNAYVPLRELYQTSSNEPFLRHSTCAAADFFHPRFAEISALLAIPPLFHRKYWEWVFIIEHARRHGIGLGKRALGFGVGAEPLSSAFAKLGADVLGTDAPPEIGIGNGWSADQVSFADSAEKLFDPKIVSRKAFDAHVSFAVCDMNAIDPVLRDFDFCWSSCCLEHLGSLKHGLDFIVNSLKTLRIGGMACHTTEFNLSSNDATIEEGVTVLYRRRDLDALVSELRARGHKVDEITIAPSSHHLDYYVDTPPFSPPHLKLDLYGYTSTSIGIVITRGR